MTLLYLTPELRVSELKAANTLPHFHHPVPIHFESVETPTLGWPTNSVTSSQITIVTELVHDRSSQLLTASQLLLLFYYSAIESLNVE